MSLFEAFILGLIQGLTEFLPVSSSGHLVIAQHLFHIEEGNLAFAIILHLGTFLSIVIAYHESVLQMVKEFFLMLYDLVRLKGFGFHKSKYRYYILYVVIASIPAAIVGILFDDYIEAAFSSVFIVSLMFIVTAILLYLGERSGNQNKGTIENLGIGKSFFIGLFQMCAITPGLSRSGTTLTGGLFSGLKRDEALEMSFLMALPAILGSLLLEIKDVIEATVSISLPIVAVGFITSLVVGLFSISLFRRIVKQGRMIVFSIYLVILSAVLFTSHKRSACRKGRRFFYAFSFYEVMADSFSIHSGSEPQHPPMTVIPRS
jgi:undecaprenyl-diphosphatase